MRLRGEIADPFDDKPGTVSWPPIGPPETLFRGHLWCGACPAIGLADVKFGSHRQSAGSETRGSITPGRGRKLQAGSIVDDKLGLQRAVVAVPGGLTGFAQLGQAGHLRAPGGGGESGKFENHR